MMSALVIAQVNLVRLFRDRTSLFFVLLLPVVIIVVLGVMYGGRTAPRLGIVSAEGGPLGAELVTALENGDMRLEIKPFASDAELIDAVEEARIEMGLVIPPGYDSTLRSGGGVTIRLVAQPAGQIVLGEAVAAAVAEQSARVRAARLVEDEGAGGFDAGMEAARDAQAALPGVTVAVTDVGTRIFPEAMGMFSLGAQSQLVLFMFLTSMTAATQLILTRQLGVSRRMLSTPTSMGSILVGETLGRFAVAMVQGLFIVLVSTVAFGVGWGDPLAAGLLVVAFALVGTGTAMALGVFANNVDQAGTLGVFAGMMLGALGGAMVPIEVFSETLKTIAHLTPHAWALDGFRELVFRGGSVVQILPSLAVLLAFAAVTLGLGIWGLRRALTR